MPALNPLRKQRNDGCVKHDAKRFEATEKSVSKLLNKKFDYIIIGAGSSGCVLAKGLVRSSSARVLLVEAGMALQNHPQLSTPARSPELWQTEADWGYWSEPDPNIWIPTTKNPRRLFLERGKTLGGSSAINHSIFVRGTRQDFTRWSKQARGGKWWSYQGHDGGMLEQMKQLESVNIPGADPKWRGTLGPINVNMVRDLPEARVFVEAAINAGYKKNKDYNGRDQAGACIVQGLVDAKSGRRMDAFTAFVEPLLKDHPDQITIMAGVMARRIHFTDGLLPRAKAVELEICSCGSIFSISAKREIILSAGALNTPQLLMLSGIGDRKQLEHHGIRVVADLPAVGKGLQDHPNCGIGLQFRADAFDRAKKPELQASTASLFLQSRIAKELGESDGFERGTDLQLVFGSSWRRSNKDTKTRFYKKYLEDNSLLNPHSARERYEVMSDIIREQKATEINSHDNMLSPILSGLGVRFIILLVSILCFQLTFH